MVCRLNRLRCRLGCGLGWAQGISIGSAVFCTAHCSVPTLYLSLPLKIAPSCGGSGPHLMHGFLGPSKFSTQTASRSVQPFLQGSLLSQTDRPTDHATQSVTTSKYIVLRCSLIMGRHTNTSRMANNVYPHHLLVLFDSASASLVAA